MWKKLWFTQQPGSSRRTRKLVHLLLIGGVTTSVVAVAGLVLQDSKGAVTSELVAPQNAVVLPTQSVRFTLYPEGIHPSTAKVRKGVISISIEDLAGANGGVLVERIGEGEPARVAIVQRFEGHWRGRSLVELRPGLYRLRVVGRETKEAELTVEP
jgi:hypothetical protein